MWKTLLHPAMIFIPFLVGWCFPEGYRLNLEPYSCIRRALMVMVFLSCLRISFRDLALRREHWIILAENLLVGVLPYALLRLFFPAERELAQAVFFTGITPTATAAAVVVSFLNGRIGFALTGFTVTNGGIALALPGLLPLVTGEWSSALFFAVCRTLFWVIVVPFAAAVTARKIFPSLRALPGKCKNFTFALWSFVLFIIAATARHYFADHRGDSLLRVALIALLSLAVCAINFYLGALWARRRFKRESSQILGQKNTTLTMYLALTYAGPLAAMGPIFYVLWHNSWNAFQMYRYDRRKLRR